MSSAEMKRTNKRSPRLNTHSRRRFLCSSIKATLGSGVFAEHVFPFWKLGRPQPEVTKIWIDLEDVVGEINPNLYGHFIEHVGRCVYDGIWVGENARIPNERGLRLDAIRALQQIKAPVLRWPGGCFADAYHWKDGIGPRDKRSKRWNLWWEQYETNAFGTAEFMQLCRRTSAEPYLSINVGTGSVEEATQWVEYCNSNKDTELTRLRADHGQSEPYGVRYWGIGNENWGCGGLYDPESYAEEYLRYALYLKHWIWPSSGLSATPVEVIAVGHTRDDWNQAFLEKVRNRVELVDHLSIHHYLRLHASQPLRTPSGGPPSQGDVNFSDQDYYLLVGRINDLERYIRDAIGLIQYYVAGRKKVGLVVDEWGVWHPPATFETGFYQQSTLRDAVIAGSVLNLLNSYCREIVMANLAQAFNVLHAIGLTRDSQMLLTPTFHVFNMYRLHQRAKLLHSRTEASTYELEVDGRKVVREAINISASLKGERLLLTIVNEHLNRELECEVELRGGSARSAKGSRLWSPNVRDHNRFEDPDRVKPSEFEVEVRATPFRIQLPAHSVNAIEIQIG